MSYWLEPITQALDKAATPIHFFFRNDDAGWADQELFQLLDCFLNTEIPIDLAVIPREITAHKQYLYRKFHDNHNLIGFHQHGYNHQNHQEQGRKCEFGSDRTFQQQWIDIKAGQDTLNDYFSGYFDPIFTPPWNRCTQETVDALIDLGFKVLSRDNTTQVLNCNGLDELPINIDWFKKHKGKRLTPTELGTVIGSAMSKNNVPVGIMLHHQIMDENERDRLIQLLKLLSRHSMAHCKRMMDLMTTNLYL